MQKKHLHHHPTLSTASLAPPTLAFPPGHPTPFSEDPTTPSPPINEIALDNTLIAGDNIS
jgi:hypothetical protein